MILNYPVKNAHHPGCYKIEVGDPWLTKKLPFISRRKHSNALKTKTEMNGLSDFHRSCQMKSAVKYITAMKSNEQITATAEQINPNERST